MWLEGGKMREYGDIDTVCEHYAEYIEKSYLSTKGLVERLDSIDPSSENYWTKTLPDIKRKIQALPCIEEVALLEGGNDNGK